MLGRRRRARANRLFSHNPFTSPPLTTPQSQPSHPGTPRRQAGSTRARRALVGLRFGGYVRLPLHLLERPDKRLSEGALLTEYPKERRAQSTRGIGLDLMPLRGMPCVRLFEHFDNFTDLRLGSLHSSSPSTSARRTLRLPLFPDEVRAVMRRGFSRSVEVK